ncbi:CD225/dispanin family protein [Psychroflexus planctonicus]|uniref:Interferon-induced transmembrane protein n=1 Tax=Psychroflexus planctonicus TaxID=1526575 RepID=A0ABQ1SE51_9FLAO|nr:CD225/dispanin family protein [Psychroflexus planctonicus]GGE31845.1 hypothetical protein GCM10010832_10210 [Psychroflexus planctonicus]
MEIQKPPHPPNHLAMAIITTIMCCQITGIVSIVYASQVNSKYAVGDYDGAIRASENAKTWWIIGLVLGVLVYVGVFLIYGLALFGIASDTF